MLKTLRLSLLAVACTAPAMAQELQPLTQTELPPPAQAAPAPEAKPRPFPAAEPITTSPELPPMYDYTFSRGEGAIPALPLPVVEAGGLRYVNGGVGDEELRQLKAQKAEYNLRIMLSAPHGEYISEVKLRLLDTSAQELLVLEDAGPYVYVKLPAGTYHLETTNPGETAKTETLNVPETGALSRHIIYNQ